MSKALPMIVVPVCAVAHPSLGESINKAVGTCELVSTNVDVTPLVCGVGGKP